MDFLNELDLFGINAKWRIFRQEKFTTNFSIFMSLVFYLYLVFKFIMLSYRFFTGSEYNISYSESRLGKYEQVDIRDLELALCIEDKDNKEFIDASDIISVKSNFIFYDEFYNKNMNSSFIKFDKCNNIPQNLIYFRKNFLKELDIAFFSKCYCGYFDNSLENNLIDYKLKTDALHIKQDFLSIKLSLKNENISISNYALKLLVKDYFLGNPDILFRENINQNFKENTLIERINNFKFELENSFLTKINFFINENLFYQKVNLEIYDKDISIMRQFSLSDKFHKEYSIKNFEKLDEEKKLEILDIKFLSNNKKNLYYMRFFGLNDFYIEFSSNVLIIFLILKFFLNFYNNYNYNNFLSNFIEKRYINHKNDNKKLLSFFTFNYFSNIDKEVKSSNEDRNFNINNLNEKNTKNNEVENFHSIKRNNLSKINTIDDKYNHKSQNYIENLKSKSSENYEKGLYNHSTENLKLETFGNIRNDNDWNISNRKIPQKISSIKDDLKGYHFDQKLNKSENIINSNNLDVYSNNVNKLSTRNLGASINRDFNRNSNHKNRDLIKIQADFKFNTEQNIKEINTQNKYNIYSKTEEDKENKNIFQTRPFNKVYDLTTVKMNNRYDIRKNIKDFFSFPKTRNKIIKDFIFKRVLDIDTYTNALLEFYKMQKILLNKDLLSLFRKISNSSIFDQNNFSYYDHCVNSYFYRDSKFTVNYDRSDSFNNYIFENLKKEFHNINKY